MRKSATLLAALTLAGSLALPAAAQEETKADPATVVAVVNGEEITLGHMIVAFSTLPQQYQQIEPALLFDGIIEQLVRQTALAQSNDQEPGLAVRLSLENEERSLRAAEAVERVMEAAASEDEVKAIYDERFADGTQSEEFNASHILLETEEDALAVIEELEGGAEFEEVAREKSTGPTGPRGGSLGWFGTGQMVPDFEAAVISLEPGEISVPVQTQFGWHVIKLNETRIPDAPPLEEVRADIELELRQAAVSEHIDALVEASDVDLPDVSGIDPVAVTDIDLLRN